MNQRKTKQQHYVPQFYMERFGTNGKIDVYNLINDNILTNQNTYNFATIRYFYDIYSKDIETYLRDYMNYLNSFDYELTKEILADEQIVEHYFSQIEGVIKNIFNDLENNNSIINNDNVKAILCNFLHDLAYRTESVRKDNQEFYKSMSENIKSIFPGIPEKYIEKFYLEEAKKEQLKTILNIKPTLKTGIKLLTQYKWFIGINTSDKVNFIISDNPAISLLCTGEDICIPISKKTALIFRIKNKDKSLLINNKHHKSRLYLTERDVLIFNTFQFINANKFIFGNKEDLILINKIANNSIITN